MTKNLFILIIIGYLFLNINNLYAKCEDNELIDLSNKIETRIKKTGFYDSLFAEEEFTELYIRGDNPDLYITVFSSETNEETIYDYEDTQGKGILFKTKNINDKIVFTIKIYSATETCKDELLKIINEEAAPFNKYSNYQVCKETLDYPYCATYLDTSDISEAEFLKDIEKFRIDQSLTIKDKIFNFLKEYYLYIVIPAILIGSFFTIKIINVRRSRKNV